jgi:DNA-binding PadR family transcriptional regulator
MRQQIGMNEIAGTPGTQMDKDMARGIIKIIILSCIGREATYPYALLKIIKKNKHMGGMFSKSDVYNMTSGLEKDGFIKSSTKVTGNKVQKMYTITAKGQTVVRDKNKIIRRTLADFKRLIEEEFNG